MHGIRRVFSLIAIILAIGALAVPAGSASLGSAAEEQAAIAAAPYDTTTNQVAWLRQCASLSCGYHVLPAGTAITVFCYSSNVGIDWNIAVTKSSYLAGHLDVRAVNRPHEFQSCSNAGRKLFPMKTDLWLHSCPAMACGYGVSPPGHDIAGLAPGPWREGFDWYLVLDHDNVNRNLVGWVHTEDIDS
ncbi:hypothetical protein ACIA8G_07575 [Lentzea sp. NPDC051213]|uniref:hypothetical protein n=1 Tax=Lentzea sp. NPDC051213 TaxID=3364126 RepID=UPI0037A58E9F